MTSLDGFFGIEPEKEESKTPTDDHRYPPWVESPLLAILGDLHIGARNCNDVYLRHFSDFFIDVFWKHVDDSGLKVVVQVGDFFDNRRYLDYRALEFVLKHIVEPSRSRGVVWYVFPGNHDSYYKNTIELNSIDLVLKSFPDVFKVINKPSDVTLEELDLKVCMIPWICDDNVSECLRVIENSESDICFGHFELSGYDMYRGMPCHGGRSDDFLKKFKTVFSGHFHTPSENKRVTYVGTPYWITKSDEPDQKRFIVLDAFSGERYDVENHKRLYIRVRSESDLDDVEGKIVILEDGDRNGLEEEVRKRAPANLITEISKSKDQIEENEAAIHHLSPLNTLLEMTDDEKLKDRIVELYNDALGNKADSNA